MNTWLTSTVIASIATGFFTYLATKRSSKAEVDQLYLTRYENMMKKLDANNEKLNIEVDRLKTQVQTLTTKLNAKDELIDELRKEKQRLFEENKELKQKIDEGENKNG